MKGETKKNGRTKLDLPTAAANKNFERLVELCKMKTCFAVTGSTRTISTVTGVVLLYPPSPCICVEGEARKVGTNNS